MHPVSLQFSPQER